MENLNGISLVVTVLLALLGAPVFLRRAGYPWLKTVFGSVTVLVVLLGVWAMMSTIQRKAGLEAVPLGWLVPLAAAGAAWRLQQRPNA